MNLNHTTENNTFQNALLNLFVSISQLEQEIETLRQSLNENKSFDLFQVFMLIASNKHKISCQNLLNFYLTNSQQSNTSNLTKVLQHLIYFYDKDKDQYLSYSEFSSFISSTKNYSIRRDMHEKRCCVLYQNELTTEVTKSLIDIISKEIEVINIINTFTNGRNNITEEIKLFYDEVKGDNNEGLYPAKLNDVFISQENNSDNIEIVSTIMKRFDVNQDCVIDLEELNNGLLYCNNKEINNINNCSNEGFVIESNIQDENNEEFYEQSRSSGGVGKYNNEIDKNIKLNFNYGGDLSILNTEEMNQHIKSCQNTDDDDMILQESHHNNLKNKKVLLPSNTSEGNYINNHNNDHIAVQFSFRDNMFNNNINDKVKYTCLKNNHYTCDKYKNNNNTFCKCCHSHCRKCNCNSRNIYEESEIQIPSQPSSNSNNIKANNQNINNIHTANSHINSNKQTLFLRKCPERPVSYITNTNHTYISNNSKSFSNLPSFQNIISFLHILMDIETEIEDKKIQLASHDDFNIANLFLLFESSSKPNSISLTSLNRAFNYFSLSLDEFDLFLFIKRFDLNYKGFITYVEFFDIFTPFEKSLRDLVEMRSHQNNFQVNSELSFDTKNQIKNLLLLILKYEKHLDKIKTSSMHSISREDVKTFFSQVDKDCKGFFNCEDMYNFIREYHNGQFSFSQRNADLMFIRLDRNRNKQIELWEVENELCDLGE